MDQLSSQWKAIQDLSSESQCKSFEIEGIPNKIWCIADPVHLIKNVRNSLMKFDINVSIFYIILLFNILDISVSRQSGGNI